MKFKKKHPRIFRSNEMSLNSIHALTSIRKRFLARDLGTQLMNEGLIEYRIDVRPDHTIHAYAQFKVE